MRKSTFIYPIAFMLHEAIRVFAQISEFTVLDNVATYDRNGTTYVSYNSSEYDLGLSDCVNLDTSFIVNSLGQAESASTSMLNNATDIFTWTQTTLTAIFSTPIDSSMLSKYCAVITTGKYANQSLTCNSSETGLAVYFKSGFPYRTNTVGFSFQNALVTECLSEFNGFIVAGYYSPSPSPPPHSGETHNDSFNLLLLIPIVSGSLFLLGLFLYGMKNKTKLDAASQTLRVKLFDTNPHKVDQYGTFTHKTKQHNSESDRLADRFAMLESGM